MNLHTETLLSAKFDNDMSTFFVDNPDQNFFPFQLPLGCIHSYSSPHSTWTSPWLDWKTLFVKLHTETFIGAKFDNDMSTFLVDDPDQKFLLLQNLLGWLHSYSNPHSIWTSPRLHWKNTFHETAYRHSFERKTWQRHEYFFRRKPRSIIRSVSAPTRIHSLLL